MRNSIMSSNCFNPRNDCESRIEGGPIGFTYVLFCSRTGADTFKIPYSIGLFKILKMLIPRREVRKHFRWGLIGFTYVLFWVSKSLEAFQFTGGFLQKKIPENVLSPEGTSACRLL